MANRDVELDQDEFCCFMCQNVLKEPVTISCGHSYCSGCINARWDQDDEREVYSCPQCIQTFTSRPSLRRNYMLAEVVDRLRDAGLQAAPARCYAGPEDVACDLCVGKKQKACKSCLVCLASYCQTHLQPHYDAAPLKKHKLVKPCRHLQDTICDEHHEVMKMFCRTDQQCVCYVCCLEEHQGPGHDVVSAAEERKAKERHLFDLQVEDWLRVREMEEQVQDLQQTVTSLDAGLVNSDRLLTELIYSLQWRNSALHDLISDQQRAVMSRTEGVVVHLEEEIAELRRRDQAMEQLSHLDDDVGFLQSCASLSTSHGSTESPDVPDVANIEAQASRCFRDVKVFMSELSKKLQNLVDGEWSKISAADACGVTLDVNTAHRYLSLSEGNTRVTLMHQRRRRRADSRERFVVSRQVLSSEGQSGRCYWEAEWTGLGAQIAVSYARTERSGLYTRFGVTDTSWCLQCSRRGYEFSHDDVVTEVVGPLCRRVGVHLDYSAGTLSFYGVSDTVTLLHRVQTTFTQPLYPGIGLGFGNWRWGDSVKITPLV
ncbi:E3 ubiquitin/ISG15 ligase TRIM25-like [Diretmus argenteus]